jgi:hypothetical protein
MAGHLRTNSSAHAARPRHKNQITDQSMWLLELRPTISGSDIATAAS